MKLNPDCIRDILLHLEEKTNGIDFVSYTFSISERKTDCPLNDKYSFEELYYHFNQCNEFGFFRDCIITYDVSFTIIDISPKAHEFLADIRDNGIWKKVKDKALQAGSFSLGKLVEVAAEIIKENISNLF